MTARWRAIAFTAFVALLWLNQSVGGKDWEELKARTLADPSQHLADAIRYPVLFLYRRSPDEEIYFATASATLGRPYDRAVLAGRGDSPLPPVTTPEDGRFHVPYAEVPFEYPPPNVLFVLLPRLFASTFKSYAWVFGALMGALLIAAALVGARLGSSAPTHASGAAPASRDSEERDEARRIFAFGLLLLAHGAVAIQRLDAIVALILILMVRAAVRRDDALLGFWGGLVGAAKFVPILVLPALVVASGVRGSKRLGAVALGATVGLFVGLGPMIALGRESLPLVVAYHSARGLHVESSLGVLYGAAKAVLGMRERGLLDYGSYNFHGPVADLLAKASSVLTLALVGVAIHASHQGRPASVARGPDGDDDDAARATRIVLTALAATTALWLGGKVFSPQYLTWALPLAIAVPGRSWMRVTFGLAVVLVLSQLYLRGFFDHVYNQQPIGVITMVVRLAVLGAFFGALIKRLRRVDRSVEAPGSGPP